MSEATLTTAAAFSVPVLVIPPAWRDALLAGALGDAAAAVPEIRRRMLDAGCDAPLIGDFHYNGHLLLTKFPACAAALDKYRINPGNVGTGKRRDEQFSTICKVAVDHGKPVRIGVNGGSLNQELVMAKMAENTDKGLGKTSEDIFNECMVMSAVDLLNENPNPTEDEVRWALSGNLCRCTGYQNIVKAVLWAADKLRGQAG